MTDGILDIRLVPRWSPSSVRADLTAALARAQVLQAGIGFWTIPDALLGPDLARTLRDKDGFVCVDLHVPTEVDALAALAAQGAHVRVYHDDIPTYTATGRKEPPSLLHTKMLLFWSADGTAELWVGSHNWTHRAILGLNVEASIVIRLRDSSPLFRAAARYLAKIKNIAEPFDAAKIGFYKEVQRRSLPSLRPVIELEAEGAARFAGATVAIFGTDRKELEPLDTIQRQVHVALFDRESDAEYVYSALILHSGLLAASDAAAGGLSFSPRRYAFRNGRTLTSLEAERPIEQTILDSARYFVTLRLGELQPDVTTAVAPKPSVVMRATAASESPLLARLDADAMQRLFSGKGPRVKRPVLRTADAGRITLAQRSILSDRPLVTMRVLRRGAERNG